MSVNDDLRFEVRRIVEAIDRLTAATEAATEMVNRHWELRIPEARPLNVIARLCPKCGNTTASVTYCEPYYASRHYGHPHLSTEYGHLHYSCMRCRFESVTRTRDEDDLREEVKP